METLNNFFLPPAKSTLAHETDTLFWFVHLSSLVLVIGIIITIVYFVIKYRRKSENETTPLITHNNTLEVTWSVIPLLLVLIIFAWGFQNYMNLYTSPEDAYEIKVTGQQWVWQFHYDNGKVSSKELHIPAGRPIKLIMSSKDVIHSFYVPDYRVKKDVVPNRYTSVWFKVPKPGESNIFCTEYCGTGHSQMLGKVIVQKPADFNKWLQQGGGPSPNMSPEKYGEQLAQQNACVTCHSTDGSKGVGPSWKGIFGEETQLNDGSSVKVDEDYIKESILNPQAKVVKGFQPVMPSFQGTLNDQQIDAIIQYIKSLK